MTLRTVALDVRRPGRTAGGPARRRARRPMVLRLGSCLAIAALWAAGAGAQEDHPGEYEVKSAFLYNFAKFVEWPPDVFPTPETPLAICVLGSDPFGPILDQTVRGERVNGRQIAVRRLRATDDPRTCHILFVSRSEERRLPQLVQTLRTAGVLTVGDMDGFARMGGIINLTKTDYRIAFEINPSAADRAGLRISSRLLSLARIVTDQP